ncbi:MAG: carbon monoxide dehydrogenase accessory protein CooC [Armatimonadetes bacterium]|nr:carbon monoxide dehydrogenase accessory protein CooC [Armatimonadota bacterium]
MKLAVTGKGGVGKTTICALLARAYADAGNRVLAVDADPNTTLASCLGFPSPENIPSLTEMSDLIEERTGVKPGTPGAIFQLNPRVDDIVERFSVSYNGISLLRMGMVKSGGAGCYCPENAFLKSLISHLFFGEQDILIMDMEAGVEHLGRGTVKSVDWLLVAVEPSRQSMDTAKRIQTLAADIGLTRIGAVCNKCRSEEEKEFVVKSLDPLPILGVLPYDESLRRSELEGRPPESSLPTVDTEIQNIISRLR